MPAKFTTIDEYLRQLPADQRAALEKIRKAIRGASPDAEECISYGLPAFRLNGRPLVAFGATANHCAFFPMDATTVSKFKSELKSFNTSKGTIRFPPDKRLPIALVKKLVKARMADHLVATGKKKAPAKRSKADNSAEEYMRDLKHPLKKDYESVRKIILGVSPTISEGIKWNSLSFRTTEWFATMNWRAQDSVQLVFHLGAKVKDNSTKGMSIPDSAGLIKWLAKDRCLVTLGKGKEVARNRRAFEKMVKAWIGYVSGPCLQTASPIDGVKRTAQADRMDNGIARE